MNRRKFRRFFVLTRFNNFWYNKFESDGNLVRGCSRPKTTGTLCRNPDDCSKSFRYSVPNLDTPLVGVPLVIMPWQKATESSLF